MVVSSGGEQSLGGAEPLFNRQLLAGHYELNRPSGISHRLLKEEILTDIEVDVSEMRTKEEYRATPGADG